MLINFFLPSSISDFNFLLFFFGENCNPLGFFQNKPVYRMNEEIQSIFNKWKTAMNAWEVMTPTFFELYTVYTKHTGQFFFHTYSLTYSNKDLSVLLKVVNTSI